MICGRCQPIRRCYLLNSCFHSFKANAHRLWRVCVHLPFLYLRCLFSQFVCRYRYGVSQKAGNSPGSRGVFLSTSWVRGLLLMEHGHPWPQTGRMPPFPEVVNKSSSHPHLITTLILTGLFCTIQSYYSVCSGICKGRK
jgi:hypothetical protein